MLAGCTFSPRLSSVAECEKRAVYQYASVPRPPRSLVDVHRSSRLGAQIIPGGFIYDLCLEGILRRSARSFYKENASLEEENLRFELVLLRNCTVVVGAGKLIRGYVLSGLYIRLFTNHHLQITKNLYYLGCK